MTHTECSWTGSERQRRPQGICLPPTKPPNRTPRFLVPPGCPCQVRPVSGTTWRDYRTRRESGFERFELYRDGHYEFRDQGYVLRVHRRHVVHREDRDAGHHHYHQVAQVGADA